jgi:hypothetical protein
VLRHNRYNQRLAPIQRAGIRAHMGTPRRARGGSLIEIGDRPRFLCAPKLKTARDRNWGQTTVSLCAKAQNRGLSPIVHKQRWDVEVNLRHIKSTLGMETLRCKTPAMAEKEIWIYLLGYNLIRWLMAESARSADVLPRQLSFKHTVQLWHRWQSRAPAEASINGLLELIAQPRVANRPGRIEPRAVKRRPKPYARLPIPRTEARDFIRENGHPNRKAGDGFRYRTSTA